MPTGISFFVWVSQRDQWCQSYQAQLQQKGGSGQGNSFFLWPIVLPQFENTPQLFHPRLCTGRNRKCLHHRLHPSSPAKRPVTFIDFWLSLLSPSNMTDSQHYSLPCENYPANLLLGNDHLKLCPLIFLLFPLMVWEWYVKCWNLVWFKFSESHWCSPLRQA